MHCGRTPRRQSRQAAWTPRRCSCSACCRRSWRCCPWAGCWQTAQQLAATKTACQPAGPNKPELQVPHLPRSPTQRCKHVEVPQASVGSQDRGLALPARLVTKISQQQGTSHLCSCCRPAGAAARLPAAVPGSSAAAVSGLRVVAAIPGAPHPASRRRRIRSHTFSAAAGAAGGRCPAGAGGSAASNLARLRRSGSPSLWRPPACRRIWVAPARLQPAAACSRRRQCVKWQSEPHVSTASRA